MSTAVETGAVAPKRFPFGDGRRLELEPEFADARRTPGMLRVKLPFGDPAWLATRMEDVRAVLTDRRMSRALAFENHVARMTPFHPPRNGLLAYDDPEHGRLRRLVARHFSKSEIGRRAPAIRQMAEQTWAAYVGEGSPADVVSHYALELPGLVIADVLGIPEADRGGFRSFADCVLSTTSLPAEEITQRRRALAIYLDQAIDHAGDLGRGLLASFAGLRRAAGVPDRLPDFVGLATALLVAGFETTANQITNFIYLLLDRPPLVRAVQADPDTLPSLVEELLRLVPLGVGGTFPRVAREDLEICGQVVRRGETVIAALGAANQDEEAFCDAIQLRPGRKRQHVAFGRGLHYCLGAHLGRLELTEALRAAFVVGPPPQEVASHPPPEWREGRMLRGFSRLYLHF
jgi:cytochrome P450